MMINQKNFIGAAEDDGFNPSRILNIDIGGSGLKAAIVNRNGDMISERVCVETPHPMPPETLLNSLIELVDPLPDYDCVSVGFPGVVKGDKIITAPNLDSDDLNGFALAPALAKALERPVRIVNDAEIQGLAAIAGQGIEVAITLGTGFGTALFENGRLAPHLELAHHPFRKGKTYDQQLGNKALKKIGKKKWNRRVQRAIKNLRILLNFDKLYIGGGNAQNIGFELDSDIAIISNTLGVKGGVYLWLPREPNRDKTFGHSERQ